MQHTRTSSLQIISTHINEKEREMISAMILIQWGCSNLVELCDVSLNPSKDIAIAFVNELENIHHTLFVLCKKITCTDVSASVKFMQEKHQGLESERYMMHTARLRPT
jgi:hypothetical protein